MRPIHTIVVPYDFSEQSEAALSLATELAGFFHAELHLVHVLQPPAYGYYASQPTGSDALRSKIARELDEVLAALPVSLDLDPQVHLVPGVHVAESVDAQAEMLGADLITIGTHARGGLAHVLHGSIAERTLRGAPCPVLVVPKHSAAQEALPTQPLASALSYLP
jgi:nucleotide-binding universal stress UspA family protein